MYGNFITVFIALTVLNTVSSKTTENIPIAVANARHELVKCFTLVLLKDKSDPSCQTKEDFKKLAEQYVDVEEKDYNRTISLNQKEIDIMLFALSHPYINDYILNYGCVNVTGCLTQVFGEPVNLNKNSNKTETIVPQKSNVLNLLFNPEEEPVYNDMTCHKAKDFKECVIRDSISTCDNHTKTFFLDSYAYNLKKCDGVKMFSPPKRTGGGAMELVPATFLTTITLTLIYMFR